MRFPGRTVLVTGASQGVGLATVQRFHAEGAHVVLLARREGPLKEAARGLDPQRTFVIAADVADTAALPGVVDRVIDRFGGIDGLVNNAGAHFRGPLESRSADEIATMVDVNLRAPLVLTRLVLPELRSRGGFVVNVASLAGKVPLDGAVTYSATKFGLRAFTFALAEELRGSGIRISAVSPGPIDTAFIMDEIDEVADITFSQTMCTAADVAEMVLDCAEDGTLEREFPALGGKLATLAYLVPAVRRMLKPRLEARGRRVKERLRRERPGRE
ncbi:MAG: SDR family NAD(P)-dependent oxidoreductase [Myxococcota bacterium]